MFSFSVFGAAAQFLHAIFGTQPVPPAPPPICPNSGMPFHSFSWVDGSEYISSFRTLAAPVNAASSSAQNLLNFLRGLSHLLGLLMTLAEYGFIAWVRAFARGVGFLAFACHSIQQHFTVSSYMAITVMIIIGLAIWICHFVYSTRHLSALRLAMALLRVHGQLEVIRFGNERVYQLQEEIRSLQALIEKRVAQPDYQLPEERRGYWLKGDQTADLRKQLQEKECELEELDKRHKHELADLEKEHQAKVKSLEGRVSQLAGDKVLTKEKHFNAQILADIRAQDPNFSLPVDKQRNWAVLPDGCTATTISDLRKEMAALRSENAALRIENDKFKEERRARNNKARHGKSSANVRRQQELMESTQDEVSNSVSDVGGNEEVPTVCLPPSRVE